MFDIKRGLLAAAAIPTVLLIAPQALLASPVLGEASGFAILAGGSVANTGTSIVSGDVGVGPEGTITGFVSPSEINNGTTHFNDGMAIAARGAFLSALGELGALPATTLTGELGATHSSLSSGVYGFTAAAVLNGSLTLNGGGNSSSQFVFFGGPSLTSAANSSVTLTNGASFENVFWVADSVTLGAGTTFTGSILSESSITLGEGANIVCGRALAQTTVTMNTNQISACQQALTDGVPGPGALALLGLGLFGLTGSTFGRRTRGNAMTQLLTAVRA